MTEITDSDTVRSALLDKTNPVIASIDEAETGFADLDARLDAIDAAYQAADGAIEDDLDLVEAEIAAARDGQVSLLAKEQSQDALIAALVGGGLYSVCTAATRPAFAGISTGVLILETDTGNRYWADCVNSRWVLLPGNTYTTAGRPTTGTYTMATGTWAWDSTLGRRIRWDGSAWAVDDRRYETVVIPASILTPRDTDGGVTERDEYVSNDINKEYAVLPDGAYDYFDLGLYLPGWDMTTFKLKFRWTSDTGSSAGDTVELGAKAKFGGDDAAIDAAYGTQQVISDTLLANNGADYQVTAATPAITPAGTASEFVDLTVWRNYTGTDDMAEDLRLLEILLQYPLAEDHEGGW